MWYPRPVDNSAQQLWTGILNGRPLLSLLSHRTERTPSLWSRLVHSRARAPTSYHQGMLDSLTLLLRERSHWISHPFPPTPYNNILISPWNPSLSLTLTHSLVIPQCRLNKPGLQAQAISVISVYQLEFLRTICLTVKKALFAYGYQINAWLTNFPQTNVSGKS